MTELDTAAAWQLAAEDEAEDPRSRSGYQALAELASSDPQVVGLTPEQQARLAGRNGSVSPDVSELNNTTLR
jgi:hypothetical protein